MNILGVSAYYHDAAAALLSEGHLIAAVQEERFTRKKHDPSFPRHAIRYCLREGGVPLSRLDYVVFYEKPLVKFERLLETYLGFAPRGLQSFLSAMPVWLKEKLFLKKLLKRELMMLSEEDLGTTFPSLLFSEHHLSHAASAFYPSPYAESAILCMDGVGEWATTSAWWGQDKDITPLWEIQFPHSVGLLYSAFTYYTGFKVNSGEYKLMGLAPYGEPKYVKAIYDHLIDLKPDGTFRLNMDYFDYCTGLRMVNKRFETLLGGPPRQPEAPLTQREMDLACSIQVVTEEAILRLARTIKRETRGEYLWLAGLFKGIWVQPAAGDAGGSLGAALAAWHQYLQMPRVVRRNGDGMHGSFLGPAYTNDEIEQALKDFEAVYIRVDHDAALFSRVADELAAEKVVGWFQGRMEFGPRALGSRSILGDPRSPRMQSVMNLKIKYRESFRPFAPSILREHLSEWFELDVDSPY